MLMRQKNIKLRQRVFGIQGHLKVFLIDFLRLVDMIFPLHLLRYLRFFSQQAFNFEYWHTLIVEAGALAQ